MGFQVKNGFKIKDAMTWLHYMSLQGMELDIA